MDMMKIVSKQAKIGMSLSMIYIATIFLAIIIKLS